MTFESTISSPSENAKHLTALAVYFPTIGSVRSSPRVLGMLPLNLVCKILANAFRYFALFNNPRLARSFRSDVIFELARTFADGYFLMKSSYILLTCSAFVLCNRISATRISYGFFVFLHRNFLLLCLCHFSKAEENLNFSWL